MKLGHRRNFIRNGRLQDTMLNQPEPSDSIRFKLYLAVLDPRVATPQRGSPQLPPLPLRQHHRGGGAVVAAAVGVAVARHDGDVAASEHRKL